MEDANPFADFFNDDSKKASDKKKEEASPAKTEPTPSNSSKMVESNDAKSLIHEIQWSRQIALAIDDETTIQRMHEIALKANEQRVKLTQIRQLENVVHTARSWSEILDFIYRQMSKHRDWQGWGELLEKELETTKEKAQTIGQAYALSKTIDGVEVRLKVQESTLNLFRGMISHFSARFAYENKR